MRPFLIAVQFLTRVPIHLKSIPSEKEIAHSQLYYPLVGLLIGIVLVALAWLLRDAPAMLSAVIVLTSWVLISGGLHLDGLADSADAWAGGLGDRDKTLAIMKDPNCGPAGVVSIVLLLLIKFAALHALFEASASASLMTLLETSLADWLVAAPLVSQSLLALLLAPMLARTLAPLLFLTTPYIRQNGLGSALVVALPRRAIVGIIAVVVFSVLWLGASTGLWLLLTAIFIFVLLRRLMMQRIGGATGDVTGALIEIAEASILLCAVLAL
ncbi:adenosylcobinamide-GDP ribazoletransferase [Beggiatoa alba]|nr:adenosylcobinamide-GDP ribazoletransferase [Beggiatoa alba]